MAQGARPPRRHQLRAGPGDADRLRSAEARAGELEQRLGATEARSAGERDGYHRLESSLRREVDEANARAEKAQASAGSLHATIEGLMAQVATLATRAESGSPGGSTALLESVGPE